MLWSNMKSQIKSFALSSKESAFLIEQNMFYNIIRCLLEKVNVDEAWYLDRHQDVLMAIRNGDLKSAKDHYLRFGYFEGKLPYNIQVDENFYLNTYPDVKMAISSGDIPNAQTHFLMSGAEEGRMPYKDFSLFKITA
ncbi:hypothetical protein [Methylobacterium frigidaeris]|nr:hypothetical protein [Methylobacterium frigidaeris]